MVFSLKSYGKGGLDEADTWAVGEIRDGVVTVSALSRRTRDTPALAASLSMPASPFAAVEITDVYGKRSVWAAERRAESGAESEE